MGELFVSYCQAHVVNDIRITKTRKAEPLVPEPNALNLQTFRDTDSSQRAVKFKHIQLH